MASPSLEASDALLKLARHSRAGAIMTIIGTVVLGAVLGYSSYKLTKLQAQTTNLQARRAALRRENDALEGKLKAAQLTIDRAQGIETTCSELRGSLKNSGALTPEARKLLEQSARATFLVGVFGSAVASNEIVQIGNALKSEGYTVKFVSALPGPRPQWFAAEPTVLYYSSKTADVAATIARQLTEVTGKRFQTRLGAGFDVPRDQLNWVLYVHDVPVQQAQP